MKRDPLYVAPEDMKWAPVDADPDFDPKRNKQIIEEVIEHNKKNQIRRKGIYNMALHERNKAIAMFLKARQQGGKNTDVTKYFGEAELRRLRGLSDKDALQRKYDATQES